VGGEGGEGRRRRGAGQGRFWPGCASAGTRMGPGRAKARGWRRWHTREAAAVGERTLPGNDGAAMIDAVVSTCCLGSEPCDCRPSSCLLWCSPASAPCFCGCCSCCCC